MIALLVVALGTVVAAVGTGVLVARSTSKPRIYSVAWAVALFGLAVGLAAATLGFLAGYGSVLFRAMEFGTQLLAPLSLALALIETTGKSLTARFAMRLAISGISVIALVILGSDPINPDVTFSKSWPDPAQFYQLAPLTVLGIIALLTAVTAVSAIGVLTVRTRRYGLPRAETRPVMFTAVAALVVVLPGLAWLADKNLGVGQPISPQDLFALCGTVSAGLIWYTARLAGSRDLSQVAAAAAVRDDRDARSSEDWDDRAGYGRSNRSPHGAYETGEFDPYGSARHDDYDSQHGGYDDDDHYGGSRSVPRYNEPVSDVMYPGLAALAAETSGSADEAVRFGEPAQFVHTGQFDRPGHYEDSGQYEVDGRGGGYDEDSGVFYADDTGYGFSRVEPDGNGAPGWDDHRDQRGGQRGELFGQITIYTLNEDRADEFDRLTEWVVSQVQLKEPETLVYIVHAVPTAPMQRILYEVYRDRSAHEEHLNRQYIITYEVEQKPFVLATNVIELGLQQAKVSPLPSISAISDILSESGIDLTGVTRGAGPGPKPGPGPRPKPGPAPGPGPGPGPRPARPTNQYQRPPAPDPRLGNQYDGPQHPEPQYEGPHPGGWAEIRGGEDSRY